MRRRQPDRRSQGAAGTKAVELAVPAREPFLLRIEGEGLPVAGHSLWEVREFRLDSLPAGTVVLRPFAPTRVRARVVGSDGSPVAARVAVALASGSEAGEEDLHWETTDAGGSVELTTTLVGCVFVHVRPLDRSHRPRVVHVGLPPRGDDAVLDVGALEVAAATMPRLRVLRSDGTPARGTVQLLRPGLVTAGELAADGGWDGLDARAGDRITFWSEERYSDPDPVRVPFVVRLDGDSPWVLRHDCGTLSLTVRGANGEVVEGLRLACGTFCTWGNRGAVELRDVPAGRVELFVDAEPGRAVRVRCTLQPGERRAIDVVLP